MKKLIAWILLCMGLALQGCSQNTEVKAQSKSGAEISFETEDHDFGKIQQGGDGTFEFVFRNTGKEPLVLSNVRSSCGCTVPEWPKEPIRKGESGVIKVSYNTRITGSFSKSITVYSNAGGEPVVLVIKGTVEKSADPL